jgi:hypothetical protein
VGGRHPERDARIADLSLRAHEPLRHRRVRDEERAGDLLGREPAERAERERDLRLDCERRVAAGEDELEPLVGEHRVFFHRFVHHLLDVEQLRLRGERPLAPDPVDRSIACGRDEPGRRARGDAVTRPVFRRDRERVLGGLLGELEVAEEADQRCEDPSPFVAEGRLEGLLAQRSTTGLTSTAPPLRAAGMRAASSSAASRSGASTR